MATAGRPERLVSGSDDFTMFLWEPSTSKAPIARMMGHMQLINQVYSAVYHRSTYHNCYVCLGMCCFHCQTQASSESSHFIPWLALHCTGAVFTRRPVYSLGVL